MDAFFKRADQADDILKRLTQRVALLEKNKSPAQAGGAPQTVGMHKDVAAYVKKQVQDMKKQVLGYEKKLGEKDKLIAKLQAQLKAKKSGGASEPSASSQDQFKQLRTRVAALRPKIQALEDENAELKAQLAARASAPSGIPTELTSNEVEYIRNKVLEIRAKVERELSGQGGVAAAPTAAAPAAASGLERMTMDTIKERKQYFVTTDLVQLKKEWYEAELGELDDEDFEVYLGREVKSLDVEEDDDTVNVRFDNHDTQWFPVGCLYKKVEGTAAVAPAKPVVAAAPAGPTLVKQTMETIKERKMYKVTTDMVELKKEWYEAELGELDDEDFEGYLGREVKSIDVEEDDDTVNVRFDNHDTQWFPVGCLYKEVEGAAPAAAPAGPTLQKQTMESIKERKMYRVTTDMVELKKEWYAAELGELDDEDFEGYLGREVKSLDVEEDDDTVNVRFDNHDTQWFPVGCLYKEVESGTCAAVAKPVDKNQGRTKQTMDSIKERKMYKVTLDMVELKKEWYEAELGELDDEDFEGYLGREVKSLDVEEDDDTVNVRFDNHDTQWFPVGCLYK